MTEPKPELVQLVFTKVHHLRPATSGLNLTLNVVDRKNTFRRGHANGRRMQIAECLVGDETGMIVFIARNDQGSYQKKEMTRDQGFLILTHDSMMKPIFYKQVDLMKEGSTVIIRNGKIDMFKGSMRLAVDQLGSIAVTEPVNFFVKQDYNLSLLEFEVVYV